MTSYWGHEIFTDVTNYIWRVLQSIIIWCQRFGGLGQATVQPLHPRKGWTSLTIRTLQSDHSGPGMYCMYVSIHMYMWLWRRVGTITMLWYSMCQWWWGGGLCCDARIYVAMLMMFLSVPLHGTADMRLYLSGSFEHLITMSSFGSFPQVFINFAAKQQEAVL